MKTNAALAAGLTGLTVLSGPVALAAPPTTSCSEERLTWLEKRVTMIGTTTVVLPPARCASRGVIVSRIPVRGDEDLPTSRAATTRGTLAGEARPLAERHARVAERHARIPERP